MSMSIDLLPSSTPPLASRPLPPLRTKRFSLLATTPRVDDTQSSLTIQSVDHVEGVMGGLRERSEDEVKLASRDALEVALKEAWTAEDELHDRVSELENKAEDMLARHDNLEHAISSLQNRYDDALNEQNRLEADIEGRDELLNLLRNRLSEAERLLRETSKRAGEQERSFDAERSALQAQETHLQQRIRSLLSARSSAPSTSGASITDLHEELASLNVSHSTLLAQLNTLRKENAELRESNKVIKEENEGWEFLLRERTFSGKVLEGGLLAGNREAKNTTPGWALEPHEQSQLEALDEEMEMDELHSDLDAQSPILDEHPVRNLDEDPRFSSSPEQEHLRPPRRKVRGENLGDLPLTNNGLDLAAELGRAEVTLDGSEMRVLGKGDEGEALRAEVKQLIEENKALTLYCSKIIDRIIAQEGFEHILSVDYKTRRMGSRSVSSTGRGNLKDITQAMQMGDAANQAIVEPEFPTVAKISDGRKARPLSLMARALSKTGGEEPPKPAEKVAIKEDAKEKEKSDLKTEKRARRGFSLDFRSLGFGSSSTSTTPTEQKPNPALKPLTLVARSDGTTSSSNVPKTTQARRLERHEEDEEDRKERHHLEATLKLMGVERERASSFSDNPPGRTPSRKLTKPSPRSVSREGSTAVERKSLISRPGSGTISPEGGFRNGTPLSRLSSVLGSNDRPLSPIEGLARAEEVSPELAAEALARFDQKEAEQVKLLSRGTAPVGYTTPSPGSIRRTRRTASGGEREQRGEQKIRQSGSISTLWSLGSSRPVSMEGVDAHGDSQR